MLLKLDEEKNNFEEDSKLNIIIDATTSFINSIYKLNSMIINNKSVSNIELGNYDVNLSYKANKGLFHFFISIDKSENDKTNFARIYHIDFTSNNLNKGLDLFEKIIKNFKNKDIIFTAFFGDNDDLNKRFSVRTYKNLNLNFNYRTIEEEKRLQQLKDVLDNNEKENLLIKQKTRRF